MSSVKLILILRTVSCSRWHLQTIINLLSRISDSSFLSGLRQTLGRLMVLGLGQETQCIVTDVNLKICRAMKIGYLNLLFVSSIIWMSMMSYTNVNSKHSNICQPFMSSPTNELAKKSGLPPAIPLPSSFALPTVVDDLHQPGELSDCKRAKVGQSILIMSQQRQNPGTAVLRVIVILPIQMRHNHPLCMNRRGQRNGLWKFLGILEQALKKSLLRNK